MSVRIQDFPEGALTSKIFYRPTTKFFDVIDLPQTDKTFKMHLTFIALFLFYFFILVKRSY